MINFNIIQHECRGDYLKKSFEDHKTITKEDFQNYSEKAKDKIVSAVSTNLKWNDLWIKRYLFIEHLKEKLK